MQLENSDALNANVTDMNSAEARARRRREKRANLTASERLKNNATVLVAVLAGVIVSIVKFIAAAITGSSAMFSEGIHSTVDAINDSLLLVGNKVAKREPDVQHPLGYGSEVYFYSHGVALVIFVLGGGFAIYEGIQNVIAGGHPIENPIINYVVLTIGIVFEGISLSVAIRTVNKARGDMHILKYIRESKSPTNITVFLEDTAAVAGMAVALIGNIASEVTGNPVIDAWASVIIGVIMASIAVILLRETHGLLIGEGLNVDEVNDIVFIVEDDPATVKCGRVLSLYLDPENLLINLDVTFRQDITEGEVLMAIDRIEEVIVSEYPQATRIFIEVESLNQVYRQRRDRKILFEAYEHAKSIDTSLEKAVEEHARRSEERRDRIKLHREERIETIAQIRRRRLLARAAGMPEETIEEQQSKPLDKKLFSEIPRIEGERIVLDALVEQDTDALADLTSNEGIYTYEPAYLFERQRDDTRETIRLAYGEIFENKESLLLAIRMKDSGELVGLAEFYGLRDRLHKISVGYRLRESFWGRGIATEALRLMVAYLYGQTDIEIITASTMAANLASARVLEKCDFIRTARDVEEDWGYAEPTLVDKWFC